MGKDELTALYISNLHNTISRVEGNCSQVKTLCITIVSAAIAFTASNISSLSIVLPCALVVVVIFWMLDTKYLVAGRKLREIYSKILLDEGMTGEQFPSNTGGFWRTFISWSVAWFYLAVSGLLIGVIALA